MYAGQVTAATSVAVAVLALAVSGWATCTKYRRYLESYADLVRMQTRPRCEPHFLVYATPASRVGRLNFGGWGHSRRGERPAL